jgi:hypothetical protein
MPHDESAPSAAAHSSSLEDGLKRVQRVAQEILTYGRYYLELHWDQVKLNVVQLALWGVLGIAGLTLLATLLVASGVLFVVGLSNVFTEYVYNGSEALGWLTGGAIVMVASLAMVAIGISIVRSRFMTGLGKKYAHKKQEQRALYGHDVEQRAATAT